MSRVLLRRSIFGVLTLWVVSIIVFAATQGLPGDAARAILGREATEARLEALRAQLGLEDPMPLQYLQWLGGVLTGDLGDSLAARMSVGALVGPAAGNSAVLMAAAAAIAIPMSILVGTYSALRRRGKLDNTVSVVTLVLAALPEFVIGILLVFIFATGVLQIFPAVFILRGDAPVWQDPLQLVLPTLTLVLAVSPYIIRTMRATMIDVLDSEYVQQARLKGVPERSVIFRHALPNAIGPVAQVIALQLAWMLGGVVLVEYLFRFPGIGFLLTDSVNNRDLPVIQATVLVIALFYVVVNLLADLITLVANPRVRTKV